MNKKNLLNIMYSVWVTSNFILTTRPLHVVHAFQSTKRAARKGGKKMKHTDTVRGPQSLLQIAILANGGKKAPARSPHKLSAAERRAAAKKPAKDASRHPQADAQCLNRHFGHSAK